MYRKRDAHRWNNLIAYARQECNLTSSRAGTLHKWMQETQIPILPSRFISIIISAISPLFAATTYALSRSSSSLLMPFFRVSRRLCSNTANHHPINMEELTSTSTPNHYLLHLDASSNDTVQYQPPFCPQLPASTLRLKPFPYATPHPQRTNNLPHP